MATIYEQYRLRGQYLSLAASINDKLEWLIADGLGLARNEMFTRWLRRTPIPARDKVRLFKSLYEENTTIPADLYGQIENVYKARNLYAHSSVQIGDDTGVVTSQEVENLARLTKEAEQVDSMLLNMVADFIEGPLPLVSADDFADWPL